MEWRLSLTGVVLALGLGAAAFAESPVTHNVPHREIAEITALIQKLESGSVDDRVRAAHTLGEMGPRAAAAVASLIKVLGHDDLGLELEAVIALGRISADAELTVPSLIRVLSDKSPILQHAAVDSLRMFGTAATAALPQLRQLLTSKDAAINVGAASAITSIAIRETSDVAAAIPVLIAGLSQADGIAGEAVHGLAAAGPTAVAPLQAVLSGSNVKSKIRAADGLAAIGPDAASAVEPLLAAVGSDNDDMS